MLSLMKDVYAKYCLLIVKMHVLNAKNGGVLRNLNALCDIEFILGFPCIPFFVRLCTTLIKLHKENTYLVTT
jgi:hypothetical protein